MNITYKISQKDYPKIIEYTLRQKARTKKSRIKLFIVTGGQMFLVLLLVLFYPLTREQKLLLSGVSILTAVLNLIYSRAFHFKASYLFSGLQSAGQFSPAFWEPHTLKAENDSLILIYGGERCLLPRKELFQIDEDKEFFYLLKDSSAIWEAVPKNAPGSQAVRELITR